MNVCTIMGRIANDLELRKTPSAVSVARFTVAVDRGYQKEGERLTDWIDVVVWRGTAEFICKYFAKGDMIALTGAVQTRKYDDKNGNKRVAVELVADKAFFCGKKTESGTQTFTPQSFSTGNAADFEEVGSDDDLPF